MSNTLDNDESEEQYPIEQTICGTLQRENNWKCFILTSLIFGCLGAVTWCRLTQVTKVVINLSLYPIKRDRQMSPCDEGYIYIPIAFMCMLYLLYLVECWHCTARVELGCLVDVTSVLDRVQQMRDALPILWWKAVCYHYVRRKRQVTRYRNGDAYTSTQVYYERVNSHAAGTSFVFAYCGVRDISRKLILNEANGQITKIRFSKGFAFANVEAAAEFEEQRTRFFSEHERYDDYMEMREGLDLTNIAGFKENVIALADPDKMPWYASRVVFWVCSFCLLSWPLRLILEYNTAYVHYQVTKLFGVNYETTSSNVATPTAVVSLPQRSSTHISLTRSQGASTVDSGELEWCIRENTALVPSYSEALLLNEHTQTQPLPVTTSSYSIRANNNNNITNSDQRRGSNRRSWGSILNFNRSTSQDNVSQSSMQNRVVLYYPSPLAEGCPADPFRGREATTPTEEAPPPYEEALRFPVLSRLRRSLTDRGEICRRSFFSQRRSCYGEPSPISVHNEIRITPPPASRGRTLITMETSL
ncbi:transmembrane protein 151B-like [Homalodisca vitripennis]|nr:transmembrane protein 151B-like [Homalodisca vitripennis]